MKDLIEEVIKKEWEQFQQVNNEGGRAACQDQWSTFHLMRKSQFLSWTHELLINYMEDLCIAEQEGRNLLSEKYAYMMESTAKDRYEEIKSLLPQISEERRERMEKAISIQVLWAEEFQREYPGIAGKGRAIRTEEDTPWNTSVETYARGEMSSYSERTEKLFSQLVFDKKSQGLNLTKEVRENMVKLYGYKSLEEAEKAINPNK